jgi:hypothetical protein
MLRTKAAMIKFQSGAEQGGAASNGPARSPKGN